VVHLLATRRASTKLVDPPNTETFIEGVAGVLYRVGVTVIAGTGEANGVPKGTFARGLPTVSGFVYSYDSQSAITLLSMVAKLDLILYYTAGASQRRKRTFKDVIFVGEATVVAPELNAGLGALVGTPFRMQLPEGAVLSAQIVDQAGA